MRFRDTATACSPYPAPHSVRHLPRLQARRATKGARYEQQHAQVLKSLNPWRLYTGASLSSRASVPDRMESCDAQPLPDVSRMLWLQSLHGSLHPVRGSLVAPLTDGGVSGEERGRCLKGGGATARKGDWPLRGIGWRRRTAQGRSGRSGDRLDEWRSGRTFSPESLPTTRTSRPTRAAAGSRGMRPLFMNCSSPGSKAKNPKSCTWAPRAHPGASRDTCDMMPRICKQQKLQLWLASRATGAAEDEIGDFADGTSHPH